MEIYLSMNETAKAQNVDTDLPYYCAYSLPGVALTLGKGHWPMLKPTFDVLAADMHVSGLYGKDRQICMCLHMHTCLCTITLLDCPADLSFLPYMLLYL